MPPPSALRTMFPTVSTVKSPDPLSVKVVALLPSPVIDTAPFTCNALDGEVVPIPTFPELSILKASESALPPPPPTLITKAPLPAEAP